MNALGHDCKARRRHSHGRKQLAVRVEASRSSREAGNDNGPIRAVAVDDSPMVLKTLSAILEAQSGVQVIGTATDGYGAVRRVLELEPDLVLMDLSLPGMNGLEATRQIKAHWQAPVVILVTAEDTPECRAAADATGTDGFVGKQQMFTELNPTIRKLFPRVGH